MADEMNAPYGQGEETSTQQNSESEQDDCIRTIACFVWAQNRLGAAIYDSFLNEVHFGVFHSIFTLRSSSRIGKYAFKT
jgi:hypothetical protein